jgi:hypothetical protein
VKVDLWMQAETAGIETTWRFDGQRWLVTGLKLLD